jgi:antitoxin component YwqK of YwqJK toxin-antitoxin module
MKQILIFICALFFSTEIYSQETVLVTKKKVSRPNELGSIEEFHVLKSNKKIKHGSYVKLNQTFIGNALHSSGSYSNGKKNGLWQTYYTGTNNIKEKGFYKDNIPDSIWQYFYPENGYKELIEVPSSEGISTLEIQNVNPVMRKFGVYRKGKLAGIWEYFDTIETTVLKFDHSTREAIFIQGQTIENHKAGYLGSDFDLYQHLYDTLDFNRLMGSIQNWSNQNPGKLVFTFSIDGKGSINDILCTTKTIENKKIYTRALEVIKSLNGSFYPRKVNGIYQLDTKTITFDLLVHKNESYRMSATESSSSLKMNFYMKVIIE